jgi:hypothetical protein
MIINVREACDRLILLPTRKNSDRVWRRFCCLSRFHSISFILVTTNRDYDATASGDSTAEFFLLALHFPKVFCIHDISIHFNSLILSIFSNSSIQELTGFIFVLALRKVQRSGINC